MLSRNHRKAKFHFASEADIWFRSSCQPKCVHICYSCLSFIHSVITLWFIFQRADTVFTHTHTHVLIFCSPFSHQEYKRKCSKTKQKKKQQNKFHSVLSAFECDCFNKLNELCLSSLTVFGLLFPKSKGRVIRSRVLKCYFC